MRSWIWILWALNLFSCEYPRGSDEAGLYADFGPTDGESVSYSELRRQVLDLYCLRCHPELQKEDGFWSLSEGDDSDESVESEDERVFQLTRGGDQLRDGSEDLLDLVRSGEMPVGGPRVPPDKIRYLEVYMARWSLNAESTAIK